MIAKYEKFHITNTTNKMSVLQIFNSVTCVNNCSNHGSCTDKGKYENQKRELILPAGSLSFHSFMCIFARLRWKLILILGKCACDTGFIGIDCSRPKNSPPENAVLPEEGLCQKSKRQCAKTNIIGDFISDAAVYVQIKEYTVWEMKTSYLNLQIHALWIFNFWALIDYFCL